MSGEYVERLRAAGSSVGSVVSDGARSMGRMALRAIAGYAEQAAQLQVHGNATAPVAPGTTPSNLNNGGTTPGTPATDIEASSASTAAAMPDAAALATPDVAAAPDTEATPVVDASATESEYGDPLENALGKVGEVSYKDETFLPGSGNLTASEVQKLVSGDDDISVANCSTFTTWMLASAGYDVKDTPDGALGNLQAYININLGLSTGSLSGDIAADSDNIKGAAAGFVATGLGVEVEQSEAKPGDFVQTWSSSSSGGHSTIIHRVHCSGAAIFGLEGSPTLVGGTTPAVGTAMGTETAVSFIIDETTDPSLVGAHTVDKVEQLGAHLAGTNSEGESAAAGVYTKNAKALSDYHKAYLGRLNESPWASWVAADVAGWSPSPTDVLDDSPSPEAVAPEAQPSAADPMVQVPTE